VQLDLAGAAAVGKGKDDVEAVRRQQRAQAGRPFDQADRTRESVFDPQFVGVLGRLEAIQVVMPDRPARAVIGQQQVEGRARDLFLDAQGGEEEAGEGGLAAAEIAAQADQVARPGRCGDLARQGLRCRQVRQAAPQVARGTF